MAQYSQLPSHSTAALPLYSDANPSSSRPTPASTSQPSRPLGISSAEKPLLGDKTSDEEEDEQSELEREIEHTSPPGSRSWTDKLPVSALLRSCAHPDDPELSSFGTAPTSDDSSFDLLPLDSHLAPPLLPSFGISPLSPIVVIYLTRCLVILLRRAPLDRTVRPFARSTRKEPFGARCDVRRCAVRRSRKQLGREGEETRVGWRRRWQW